MLSEKTEIDVLKEIEQNYSIEKIRANGVQIWPILRAELAWGFFNVSHSRQIKNKKFQTKEIIINIFQYIFWEICNIGNDFPYMVFTNILETRYDKISGKCIDKLFDGLINVLNSKKVLINISPSNYDSTPFKDYCYENIVSSDFFLRLIKKIIKKPIKIYFENESILQEVFEKYAKQLNLNYNEILVNFFLLTKAFRLYFRIRRPRTIFCSNTYSLYAQAMLFAAKERNIRTVELQHGLINNQHFGYKFFKDVGKDVFPDYMITFGEFYSNVMKDNFVPSKNIYPVGSFYNYYTKRYFTHDKKIKIKFHKLREKYNKIVVCSGDIYTQRDVISLIIKASYLDDKIAYIYMPRIFSEDLKRQHLPKNVFIDPDINFYKSIMYCDIHMTVSSTCALEAFTFGKINILININNMVNDLCGEEFAIGKFSHVINTEYEMVDTINTLVLPNSDAIKKYGKIIYKDGDYHINLRRCLKLILSSHYHKN